MCALLAEHLTDDEVPTMLRPQEYGSEEEYGWVLLEAVPDASAAVCAGTETPAADHLTSVYVR